MGNYALFGLVWTNVAVPVDTGSAQMVAALMARVGPWFRLCVGAYLLIMMLIASWSEDADAIQRLFRSLFLAAIVYAIAFNAPTFDYYVTQLVHGTTNAVSTATASLSPTNGALPLNADSFDIIMSRCFSIGLAVLKNLPINPLKSVPLGFCVVIYWFLSTFAVVIMYATYLISYVLGAFVMAFGPLFIPLYFFPFTRKYFDGWLSCVMTTILVQIFTAALASMFVFVVGTILNLAATGLAGNQLANVDGGVVIGEIMMLVATALICFVFSILSGSLVYVAVRITGGAHAELGKLRAPSWMPSWGGGGMQQPQQQTGPGGANGGSMHGLGGSGTAGQPPRDHAFNRTVTSAP
jgi:type IV secretory pathway VirB6-like protein